MKLSILVYHGFKISPAMSKFRKIYSYDLLGYIGWYNFHGW